MNQPERREVSAEMRSAELKALRDPDGHMIYDDGWDYLAKLDFDPPEVVLDLIDYLEEGSRLYVLPENPRKCHCCLRYETKLIVYVKISPKQSDGTFFVRLDFHSHNTGYPPLPS